MLSENLKSLLEDKEISATLLAKKTGIGKSTILGWLSGVNSPRADQLLKVAQYLNTSVDFLLTGENAHEFDLDKLLEKFTVHSGLYELTIKKVIKKK